MFWLLGRIIINSLALFVTAWIVPGFGVNNFVTAVVAAIVLGVINAVIRPFMLLLTLPLNILTLGLFTFIINALMLWFTSVLVPGLYLEGPVSAILAAIVLSIVSMILSSLFRAGAKR